VQINGKDVTFKMDIGAIKLANKYSGKNILNLKNEEFADIEVMTAMVLGAAERGGSDVTMAEIDALPLNQLEELANAMQGMMSDFAPAGDGDPLAEDNPQA